MHKWRKEQARLEQKKARLEQKKACLEGEIKDMLLEPGETFLYLEMAEQWPIRDGITAFGLGLIFSSIGVMGIFAGGEVNILSTFVLVFNLSILYGGIRILFFKKKFFFVTDRRFCTIKINFFGQQKKPTNIPINNIEKAENGWMKAIDGSKIDVEGDSSLGKAILIARMPIDNAEKIKRLNKA